MKYIIDRIITRGERGSTQDKEICKKVHEDLLEKYCCNKPTVRDLETLFRDLQYDVNSNLETHLKIQSTFELLNAMK